MSEVSIDLVSPTGVLLEDTMIPADYTVRQVIDELVDSWGLPRIQNGANVDYSLHSESQNVVLEPTQTLADAGVARGERLKLVTTAKDVILGPGGLPEAPAPSQTTVDVVLAVLDLNTGATETFNLDMTVEDLVRLIAKKYKLPDKDHLSVATIYKIQSKALGRILKSTETLRIAGVPRLDRLSVVREEIAG